MVCLFDIEEGFIILSCFYFQHINRLYNKYKLKYIIYYIKIYGLSPF